MIETAENIYEDIHQRKYKDRDYLMHLCLQAYSRCDEVRGMLDTLTKEEHRRHKRICHNLMDSINDIKKRVRKAIYEITGREV